MKANILVFILLVVGLISCEKNQKLNEIQISWINDLSEDFSFKDKWSYSEGIFRNEFGQLDCDGNCPSEIAAMKNDEGQIFVDSLNAFYNLVDTTHYYHSIESESNAYEWAGTNYIFIEKISNDTVVCITQNNASTHSSLNLIIIGNIVKPTITLESIGPSVGTEVYNCMGGEMVVDKNLWGKGILKASFDFNFEDTEKGDRPIYWKGKIYTTIRK